ncbi:hypothetical protein AB205_0006720, partial [Aquarana catesbeiana]
MKLEAVDKRNPMLIRVCTIVQREENRIQLHFDGWSSFYDYWVDADSPDIHPVLETRLQFLDRAVLSLVVKGSDIAVGCPYSEVNLNRESLLQDRLSGEKPLPAYSPLKPRRPGTPNPTPDPHPDSPQSRKSPTPTEEQFGKGSMWEMAEWLEDEAEIKPQIKK